MAIAPRLDLRQSQTLVMTPQLRQAIKLLQFSNIEVNAFVEEELERNPLLERDDTADAPIGERAAPDQIAPPAPAAVDSADAVEAGTLPSETAAPLDIDTSNSYDPGGISDGAPLGGRIDGSGGSHSFDADDRTIEDFAGDELCLRDHLGEQLRLNIGDPVDRMIGAHLIALLCPAGRLTAEPAAIARAMGLPLEQVEAVRARMMRFDPVGLFARDLKECLAAQLAERNRLDPAMQALLDNLDLLARRDNRRLMAVCEVDAEDLADMIAEIRALDPKPGASFDTTPPQLVVPDLLMRQAPDGGWIIELNPETMPRVLVNERFYAKVAPRAKKDEKVFLTERLANANWLVRSLQQRAQTILKVASEIIRQQEAFLRLGVAHLRPLILRDIAEAVELHESTVSRVTANKYIATPRGTFELKYFFTTAIQGTNGDAHSAEAVRHRIRTLIDREPPSDVLSDDALVIVLRREGIDIARRTVAKYREALRIPNSVQRRREKTVPA
ncbi:RNA polymerase factor sigma-54 [Rhodopila globiformis]|uniref:RNA polymerase sigma-54 factor n=1 Tax=Rhodopila globiformis TaxID=1071 RepID=A0A2S6NAQ4_RHOGL|nr:RNA polymerase factor sigma-54 [Rhodopila globiformis]PPQ31700.1 RNA polymerase sigma-54 factor [Rhodopila globiformis]